MKRLEKVFLVLLFVETTATYTNGEQRKISLNEIPDHHGKNFLLGFLEMRSLLGYSNIYITSTTYCEVRVFVPFLNLTRVRTVMPGISTKIQLPSTVRMKDFSKEKKGILISSNVSISVYASNAMRTSRDVHVVFPISALGTEHIGVCFTPKDKSLIGIIASADNTLVRIRLKLPRNESVAYKGRMYWSGDVLKVFLNKLESFQVQHRKDLTGTVVISSQPVAVLSGNVCASVPAMGDTCSHLVAQIPSLPKWGKSFITTPVYRRRKRDIFRVVSAYDDTLITIIGRQKFKLNAGEFHQFELGSSEKRKIISSRPCMLVQFNKDSRGEVYSEPFTLVVPPTEQYGFGYDLVIPVEKTVPPFEKFIGVVAETSQTQAFLFNPSFLLSGNFTWDPIPGTKYSIGWSQLEWSLNDSSSISIKHTAGDVRFTVVAVGHTDSDGYGYVGGMALVDINCQRLFPQAMKRGDRIDNDCDGRVDEESENGLDDDGDGVIDEDLEYVVHDCDASSILYKANIQTNVYLNGSKFNYSITQGDCESLVKITWYIPSPIGPSITLAEQYIKWRKPNISVSFPPDAYIDHLNISTLEYLKPNWSSLCPADNIRVTYNDIRSTIGKNVTLIRRSWIVREKCGRTYCGDQTIIERLLIQERMGVLKSQSSHALVLGLCIGLGTFGLLATAVSVVIIWKKHVSRSLNISVRIDVLEAKEQEWHYTNAAAITEIDEEHSVYTEINKNKLSAKQTVTPVKFEPAPPRLTNNFSIQQTNSSP